MSEVSEARTRHLRSLVTRLTSDRSGYFFRRPMGMRWTIDVLLFLRARDSEMNRPVLADRPRNVNRFLGMP